MDFPLGYSSNTSSVEREDERFGSGIRIQGIGNGTLICAFEKRDAVERCHDVPTSAAPCLLVAALVETKHGRVSSAIQHSPGGEKE